MTPIFPLDRAKNFLIKSVAARLIRSIDPSIQDAAPAIVELHLDPKNFAMPRRVDSERIFAALREGINSIDQLRLFITFEDTHSIQGICRVMIRTHLNRSGINFVSRGEGNKTLSRRVLGPFDGEFKPKELLDWGALLSTWLAYAKKCNADVDDGEPLFNSKDIDSLDNLRKLPVSERQRVNGEAGIHNNWWRLVLGVSSGLQYLNEYFDLDPQRVWSRIESASASARGVDELVEEVKNNVYEYGFALAGSFLADLGNKHFIKVDTHVRTAVAAALKKEENEISNQLAFDVIRNTAEVYGVSPRSIDKIMYLAGSGNFYLLDYRLEEAQQLKKEFLEHLRQRG